MREHLGCCYSLPLSARIFSRISAQIALYAFARCSKSDIFRIKRIRTPSMDVSATEAHLVEHLRTSPRPILPIVIIAVRKHVPVVEQLLLERRKDVGLVFLRVTGKWELDVDLREPSMSWEYPREKERLAMFIVSSPLSSRRLVPRSSARRRPPRIARSWQ